MKQCHFLFVFLLSLSLLGCDGAKDKKAMATIPVTGKLSVDGKPQGSCQIIFTPIVDDADPDKLQRKSAVATVAADGTFTLRTHGENDGAIPGKYSVSIASDMSSMKMDPVPEVVPQDVEIQKPADGSALKLDVALKGTGKTMSGIGGAPASGGTPP